MLIPENITDHNFSILANQLLQEQMEHSTAYIRSEIRRWNEKFVSDDGTDYVQTALDALGTLMRIRYEGNAQDLRDFLFTSRREYGTGDQYVGEARFLYGPPAMYIDSAEGLCDTIMEILEPMYKAEEGT